MHGVDKDVKLISEKLGTCHRALHLTLSYLLFWGFLGGGCCKKYIPKVYHLAQFLSVQYNSVKWCTLFGSRYNHSF